MPHSKKTATAYHESGHWILARIYARPVDYVSIRAANGINGETKLPGLGNDWDLAVNKERDILLTLGGYAAQRAYELAEGITAPSWTEMLEADRICEGAVHDAESCFRWAKMICSSDDTAKQCLKSLATYADELLSQQPIWQAVQLLADELVSRKDEMLTFDQADAVFNTAGCKVLTYSARLTNADGIRTKQMDKTNGAAPNYEEFRAVPSVSPSKVVQLLIGVGISLFIMVTTAVFAVMEIGGGVGWWIATFFVIWVAVFLALRRRYYAMIAGAIVGLVAIFIVIAALFWR